MKNLIPVGFTASAAIAVLLLNSIPVAAETSLKLVSMLAKKHPVGIRFGGFVTRINKQFKGDFQIDWRGGPEIVPQFKQANAVRIGSIDMTITSPSYVNGILPVSGSANYSNKTYDEIKATGYLDYMTKLHAEKGLVYVGELPVSELRFHIFLRNKIQKIADLKNLKIRVFPAIAPAVKALGASPLVLPMGDIYTAMERGIIDGFAQGVSGIGKQYQGLVKGYVEPGFYRATFHLLANPKSWQKVPQATRAKIIDYVRNKESVPFEASWKANLASSYKRLAGNKIEAIHLAADEKAKFKSLVFDAAWAAVRSKSSEQGKRLQSMLMK
jgi:TRAP-type C4-dicarboxylate transport system substrate-binding protein